MILLQVPEAKPGNLDWYKREISKGVAAFIAKHPLVTSYALYERGTGRLWHMPREAVRTRPIGKDDYEALVKPHWLLQRLREPWALPQVPYTQSILVNSEGEWLFGVTPEAIFGEGPA